jgi:hypothetical protein
MKPFFATEASLNDHFTHIWCKFTVSYVLPLRCLQQQYRAKRGGESDCLGCKTGPLITQYLGLFGRCLKCGMPLRIGKTRCEGSCFMPVFKNKKEVIKMEVVDSVQVQQEEPVKQDVEKIMCICQNSTCGKGFEPYTKGKGKVVYKKLCPDCLQKSMVERSKKANAKMKEERVKGKEVIEKEQLKQEIGDTIITIDFKNRPDVLKKLQEIALEEERTVAQHIIYVLRQYISQVLEDEANEHQRTT